MVALAASLVVMVAMLVLPIVLAPPSAADPCGVGGNKVACENTLPGSSGWDVAGAGDPTIQGFSTDISVNLGERIDFKVDTTASAYSIDIYRIGYYQGSGARRVASVAPVTPIPRQPQCISDTTTALYDCGNWAVSASWTVPSTAVSGVYIAKLTRSDNGGASHITFVVRDDASTSDVVFQTSDTTWQAYNTYGGADFYRGGGAGRAFKISYNRPVSTRGTVSGRDFFFANEYPLVRFMERNGYDVSYLAGVDTDRRGQLLRNHRVFLSVGHDEYWSGPQRANVEAARDAGVHLQFLSGNEVYWKTRYEPSIDASRTPYRTLVSYKETWGNAKIDPSDEWTGTWRDPRYAAPAKGAGRPENQLTGTAYMANFSDLALTVNADEGKLRLWRNTSLANLASGSVALAPHTIGYESNEDLDNGFRPPGLVRLSTTIGAVPEYLQDFGNTVAPGTSRHHLTLYKAPSGALVFSAGTIQWTWGLDEVHDSAYGSQAADSRMQQAQVNLFADMGAQPATLQAGLVPAARSTDTTAPTVAISSPAPDSAQRNGDRVTISGIASDTGGRVAGVEVSIDGGSTWHAAAGTTSWSYSFIQRGRGSSPVDVRAVDDSANIGESVTRWFEVSCPCSIFGDAAPATPAASDTSPVELGIRFTPVVDGFVTGIRFYKGAGNGGTHVGSLWGPSGQRLAQATFSSESPTGWQTTTFTSPVAVTAGQTYTASYTAPVGRYATQPWAFAYRGEDATVLQVAGGYGATPAGVYGNVGTLPTLSYQGANYFVDVEYTATDPGTPLVATNQNPAPDATGVPVGTTVSATFSQPLRAGTPRLVLQTAQGAQVAGATAYNASTRTITFTPAAPLAGSVRHTATLFGTNLLGRQVGAGRTWSFTTRSTSPGPAPGATPTPGATPVAPGCDGLTRAEVLGKHLATRQLSDFPNANAMCAGIMLPGAAAGFIPQGLAMASSTAAWVTGYVPRKGCRVMRVDLESGKVRKRQIGIDAKGVPACARAGGALLNKHGLWVADTKRLWLLDPQKVGTKDAVIDHWRLHQGKPKRKSLEGSFLLDAGRRRIGLGQRGGRSDTILMYRYRDVRRSTARTLIRRGDERRREVAPAGRTDVRARAQGAARGPGGALYVSASVAGCGLLDRNGTTIGFGPGVEEFEFVGGDRVWAVFKASSRAYAENKLVVPMLAQFDANRLLGPSAQGPDVLSEACKKLSADTKKTERP